MSSTETPSISAASERSVGGSGVRYPMTSSTSSGMSTIAATHFMSSEEELNVRCSNIMECSNHPCHRHWRLYIYYWVYEPIFFTINLKLNNCSSIAQWGFYSVPHLLWHRAYISEDHLLCCRALAMTLSLLVYTT